MQRQKISKIELEAQDAKKGFKVNLAAYAVVNSMLVTINMLTVPSFPWFLFPLCGWGFGLSMHYYFGVRRLGKEAKAQTQAA
jgi:hypothetical protein